MNRNTTVILAIDTSTIACSVALCNDKELLQEFRLSPSQHNEILLGMVDRVIKRMFLKRTDIQMIVIGNGIGSSMGSRLSTSIAEGLAFALKIPIIKIPTMQMLAQVSFWRKKIKRIVPAWDMGMKRQYCGDYLLSDNYINPVGSDLVMKSKFVNPFRKATFLSTGNAWKIYTKHTGNFSICYPEARSIIFLIKKMFKTARN